MFDTSGDSPHIIPHVSNAKLLGKAIFMHTAQHFNRARGTFHHEKLDALARQTVKRDRHAVF